MRKQKKITVKSIALDENLTHIWYTQYVYFGSVVKYRFMIEKDQLVLLASSSQFSSGLSALKMRNLEVF